MVTFHGSGTRINCAFREGMIQEFGAILRSKKSLKDIAPDLGKFIVGFAFGDIYTREGLTTKEREMITLSSLLTAGGCQPDGRRWPVCL